MGANFPILHFPRYSRINQYLNARLRQPEINRPVISKLIQSYDFDLLGDPWNLPYGRRGSNIAMETSAGIKVLRRYRKKWREATINYEHSILARLAENNCPAPRLNQTVEERSLVSLEGDHYALFDFVSGISYASSYLLRSQRLSLLEKSGAALAKLHRCLEGYTPEGQHHLGFISLTGDRRRDLDWHAEKIAELITRSKELLDSEEISNLGWIVNHSEQVWQDIMQLDQDLNARDLSRVVIHGDFGLHNILFHDSNKVIPLDFELARIEWRLSDFVISFLRLRNRRGEYDLEGMRRFIKAYLDIYPVASEEWKIFPKIWRHTALQFSIQYWNSYFEMNHKSVRLDLARDAVRQAGWAQTHRDALIDLSV